jgi:hypothetical protein
LVYCADADIPELTRLAATIDSWRTELLAYFDTGGVSNGPTEATNLLIKKIKRVGHGFRNFDNYRLRLLLHRGVNWDTIGATPIRGRLPRRAEYLVREHRCSFQPSQLGQHVGIAGRWRPQNFHHLT